MTTPTESQRAVEDALLFHLALIDSKWPRVPAAVREEARRIFRHYPGKTEIARLYSALDQVTNEHPDVAAKRRKETP